jgi:hypothetical protein
VPRLVLINGAPGSGKSTLARRYAHDHPLTLVLDVDRERGMLGRWLDTPTQAGLLARQMAIEMAACTCTPATTSSFRSSWANWTSSWRWRACASRSRPSSLRWCCSAAPMRPQSDFARRSQQLTSADHQDAAAFVERCGGPDVVGDTFRDIYRQLLANPESTIPSGSNTRSATKSGSDRPEPWQSARPAGRSKCRTTTPSPDTDDESEGKRAASAVRSSVNPVAVNAYR